MEIQDVEVAIKNTADSIRKTPAVRRRKNVSYAVVVKVGYEEIQKLKNDGYSYEVICKMLAENGALGADANAKNFCSALSRETKRRLARTQGATQEVSKSPVKTTPALSARPEQKKTEPVPTAERDEAERERIKRLISPNPTIGVGKTVRQPDGSFDVL